MTDRRDTRSRSDREQTDSEDVEKFRRHREAMWDRTRDPNRSESLRARLYRDDDGPLAWLRELFVGIAIILLVGGALFALSGTWPPMVAVESGSMEPNINTGDLVFVTEPGRFGDGSGVVAADEATADDRYFGERGSVIVFRTPDGGTPTIHRAHFYVEEGENWIDRADPAHLDRSNCDAVEHCPAPHSGYVTKGDNNNHYDQDNGIAPPVREEWVISTAYVRIPYVGWLRLTVAEAFEELTDAPATVAEPDPRSAHPPASAEGY